MYHAVPYAERYAATHPGTGVIRIEWLDRVIDSYRDPEQVFRDSRPKPGVFFGRWLSVATNAQLEKRIGGRRAALLTGLDKPCVIRTGDSYRGFFPEGLMRVYTYCTKSNGFPDNVIWEPFYWTPDLPELAIRGWYEIIDLCRKDPIVAHAHDSTLSTEQRTSAKMSRYVQDAMRRRLYPGFDSGAWQADKQSEWGFFMQFELPVLQLLKQRQVPVEEVLGEVLAETAQRIGESSAVLGDSTAGGLTPWARMSDGYTILDYKSFTSRVIDLNGRP